ncbi:MAG: beta-eliminating lyase-related protein [Clostridia bacterium]|nr:beta-eliminating lyase-related protein [Clostridia bacterium]
MKKLLEIMLSYYAQSNPVRLHMPGNKGKLTLDGRFDITELPCSGNLLYPNTCIESAQQQTATVYGSKRCRYLVNGSTIGIMGMVAVAVGDILMQRNSHISAYNALRLFDKRAYVLNNIQQSLLGKAITVEQIDKAVRANPSIGTVLLTSPNYMGDCCDIVAISKYCKQANLVLMCDSAHGGHHMFSPLLPESVTPYCDLCVVSVHKDLTSLTQTALMLGNNDRLFDLANYTVGRLTSTSPNYIMLSSIERAVVDAYERPDGYTQLSQSVSRLKSRLENVVRFKPNDDFTRLVIDTTSLNMTGEAVYMELEKRNIFCDVFSPHYVIMLLSVNNTEQDFIALESAIRDIESKCDHDAILPIITLPHVGDIEVVDNLLGETELVPFNESVGRICADNVGIAPPCIPLILAGQVITQHRLDEMKGKPTVNLVNGAIEVVK